MKATVTTLEAKSAGSVELSDAIFGLEPRSDLIHRMVRYQLLKRMAGTHHAQDRSEVTVTGKKMYKQKGTGNARHGSKRAPVYVGGGRAHPPRPRDWSYRPPAKVRQGALTSALSKFQKEGRLVVVDRFELAEIKTKALVSTLATLKTAKKTLVVDAASNENLKLSIRNCKDHQFLPPEGVNVYDLLRHDTLVLSKDAAKALELRCLKKGGAK